MAFDLTQPATWNVIITDDEPDSIGVVQFVFKFQKARVRTASSGPECVALLGQELPDVLFLDLQMPHMSGWDVLKQIRSDPRMQSVVVIAMTAHAMQGDRERIMSAGFDGYFPKPLSPMSLVADVTKILLAAEKQRASQQAERSASHN